MSEKFIEPQDEVVESFLPAEDEPFDPDEELIAAEAILDFPEDEDLVVEEEEPPPFGRSWAFDFSTGKFVKGGLRGTLTTSGEATLHEWIVKCLQTARGAHPIHSDEYGMVEPFAEIGEPVLGMPGADYETRVREALTFHPRIVDVQKFEVAVDPNSEVVEGTFEVVLDDDTTLPITLGLL